jgi:hypothetical protein
VDKLVLSRTLRNLLVGFLLAPAGERAASREQRSVSAVAEAIRAAEV